MAIKRYPKGIERDQIYPAISIRDRDTDMFIQYNIEDKLELIANRAYNEPGYWWIIMLANPEYTMEYEIEPGELIRVPLPLNSVISEIKDQLNA